jgi:phage FluMu protein gp41
MDTASLLVSNRNHSWGHAVARVGAVSGGTVLQAERSQVRFPMMLLGMRDQKVIGDYDAPGDVRVLKRLGEDGVRRVTQLIKTYMKLEGESNISLKLQRVKSHKIQRPSHNQTYCYYRKYSSEDT